MVTIGELAIGIALFWLVLIMVANRVNLQKFGLYISSGFLLFMTDKIDSILKKLASKKDFWTKLGNYSIYPSMILFIAAPLILSLNLVKGYFFEVSPVFITSVMNILRIENFLLTLPILALFLSAQMFVKTIYGLISGKEINRAGFLFIGFILTFFGQLKGKQDDKFKLQAMSVIIIFQLIMVLVALPLGNAVQGLYQNAYENPTGALITSITPNTPAASSNLEINQVITQIRVIQTQFDDQIFTIYSSRSFERTMTQIPVGFELLIRVYDTNTDTSYNFQINGITPPESSDQRQGTYLGLYTIDYREPKSFLPLTLPFWSNLFFDWLFNLSFLFLLQSVLPLPRTMGVEFFEEIKKYLDLEISDRQTRIISYFSILLLAGNVLYLVT